METMIADSRRADHLLTLSVMKKGTRDVYQLAAANPALLPLAEKMAKDAETFRNNHNL